MRSFLVKFKPARAKIARSAAPLYISRTLPPASTRPSEKSRVSIAVCGIHRARRRLSCPSLTGLTRRYLCHLLLHQPKGSRREPSHISLHTHPIHLPHRLCQSPRKAMANLLQKHKHRRSRPWRTDRHRLQPPPPCLHRYRSSR